MKRRRYLSLVARLTAALVIATAATSAWSIVSCVSTFVDVPSDASYCEAAEWLQARSITVGCTDTTHFCPDDAVTRASMALFLNRLAIAIAPTFEHVAQTFGPVDEGGNVFCQTPVYIVPGFNKIATGDAMFYFVNGTGSVEVDSRLVYSVNEGANWNFWSTFETPITAAANTSAGNSVSAPVIFSANQTVIFGLSVNPFTASGVFGGCEIRVRLENYNFGIAE